MFLVSEGAAQSPGPGPPRSASSTARNWSWSCRHGTRPSRTPSCRRWPANAAAIYHAIVEQADDIRLARFDQREAILDEIPVPDPPAELVPRDPGARDLESAHRKRRDTGTREVYGAEQRTLLVMEASPDFGTAQVTARALESAGMIDRVFNPIAAYHGYPCYDELDRITGISVTAAADGKRTAPLDDEPNEYAGAVTRVDRITVTLYVANRCSGAKRDFALDTDVSFTGNEPASHDEIGIVLMRNAWIETDDLAEMMMRAFFSTSMDADAESSASRKESHEVEYARIAIGGDRIGRQRQGALPRDARRDPHRTAPAARRDPHHRVRRRQHDNRPGRPAAARGRADGLRPRREPALRTRRLGPQPI